MGGVDERSGRPRMGIRATLAWKSEAVVASEPVDVPVNSS
jgi:hypothetical protein